MKRFMIKCFILVITLFFGVLLGMQQANEGLLELKGFPDQEFEGAFQMKKNEVGEIEASVLGKEITTHDIEEKQKKIEEMKAFRFFNQLAQQIANMMTRFFQQIVHLFIIGFEEVLSFFQ